MCVHVSRILVRIMYSAERSTGSERSEKPLLIAHDLRGRCGAEGLARTTLTLQAL